MDLAVDLSGITKRFGAFTANSGIDLAVRRGEIHAIIGENGAGKTTLMNILFGLLQPDEGTIAIGGKTMIVDSPAVAIGQGLGMVHQHFKLVPSLTVADNIFLGMEIRRNGLIDRAAQEERTRSLSEKFRLRVDPRERVAGLSVGMEQRIEILKVLARNARTIILDEPTAVLTPQESRDLFRTLRSFVDDGMTVIFISHHLEEVMAVSDTVTVLRDGRVVATKPKSALSKRELVRLMVGRDVSFDRRPRAQTNGKVALEVEDLWVRDDRQLAALKSVSLSVRAGEIVGIAGVAGNGQTELAEVLSGLRPASHGRARLHGQDILELPPAAIRARGLAHVPGDRMVRGVDRTASLSANMLIGRHRRAPFARAGVIDWSAVHGEMRTLIRRFDIRARGPKDPARSLSGGNIQKVVLAREFTAGGDVLLIDQPTRGVDIGAQEGIHDEIMRQRAEGRAILLISTQLDELRALADRILVMFDGRIMGAVDGAAMDEDAIGLMMAGVDPANMTEA
ncbi:heme ABC transporter ATP-binding protein [Rhizobium rhizosphaerae]|uniref:Heme ABC transporter ATP-binding protein n=1 Tax=Xaviernesmea rhizosphaerae TaxID=1672749 RepID=A0ABX3PEQ7_9HYPH|nr:ABC transporter ATP-binding protein [Xaviernesmea rhizosphaerae]OQP86558.1 heme ABC transporter ATP-binding protein [Xaviernesmea rhizosphaerae]